jgi:hypothetical protein
MCLAENSTRVWFGSMFQVVVVAVGVALVVIVLPLLEWWVVKSEPPVWLAGKNLCTEI